MKFVLLGIVAVFLIIIFAIPAYLGPDDLKHCSAPTETGKCQKVDAIVAVSGGDTGARTDEAVKLYKAGWGGLLIFSGAAADPNGPSNAESMAKRAEKSGVPASDIAVEELSRTTEENAENTSQFIEQRGITRIALVTSAYHQRRALLDFRQSLGKSVTIVNHPVATDKQWAGVWWWTTRSGWWLAIGELLKIIAFYASHGASRG